MHGIYFILPTLLVILISFLVVRAGSIALMFTGLDMKRASFQALSAFSGTGFTTKEAENVINHPKRRKIISWLMILGNAGIVTVIVTATSSLVTSRGFSVPLNIIILILGIFIVYRIATHKGVIRRWESFIEDKLVRSKAFEEEYIENLLRLIEGYSLVRVMVRENSELKDKTLLESKLTRKGLLVIGIERENRWVPIPKAEETIQQGDRLIVYGPLKNLKEIFK